MSARAENQAIEVFFSYAHEDEELRDELAKHLRLLERQKVIATWYDREIDAGTEWKHSIEQHLNSAQVILLLISADFLASDFCWGVELKRAMKRHETEEARIIPIILREVDWKGAPFGKLQALPKNAKPVKNWEEQDQAFADIARGIRRTVEELNPKKVRDGSRFSTDELGPEEKCTENVKGSLTPRQRRRLEQELDDLQQPYKLLSEKLRRLRKKRAIVNDPSVELQLDVQIEEAQGELDKLELRINSIEQEIGLNL